MSKEDILKKLKKLKKAELLDLLVSTLSEEEEQEEQQPEQSPQTTEQNVIHQMEQPVEQVPLPAPPQPVPPQQTNQVQFPNVPTIGAPQGGDREALQQPVKRGPRPNKFFEMPESQMHKQEPGWTQGAQPAPRNRQPDVRTYVCHLCKQQFVAYGGSIADASSARCENCMPRR